MRLVLFDIDGTLLVSDGAGKEAMRQALEHVYGTPGAIASWNFGGRCDRDSVFTLMEDAGLAHDVIEAGFEQVEREMCRFIETESVRALAGSMALLDALDARPEITVGILTGNFRRTADLKLEAAGFAPQRFAVGAYGSEARDRAALPPLALRRAQERLGLPLTGPQTVIIGDTTHDVQCGRGIEARSIAVLTGSHDRPTLEAASPTHLFDDLTQTNILVDAILEEVS